MKMVASACMVLTIYGLAVVVVVTLIRILIHPLTGAIRHSVYQIAPFGLPILFAFEDARSLVELDAF